MHSTIPQACANAIAVLEPTTPSQGLPLVHSASEVPALTAPKKRYRAIPTLLKPVAVLTDRHDLQIELTVMMIGNGSGLLSVVSHERHAQRVSILFPDRQLGVVSGPNALSIERSCSRQGTTVVFQLESRDTVGIRFHEQVAHKPGADVRIMLEALGEHLPHIERESVLR